MFRSGQIYNRQELHRTYGGQHQTGICTPSDKSYIFLFTGGIGPDRGYIDGWTDAGTFSYSGQGQSGDMEFLRGNAAIRDHAANGKDLHLFENVGRGMVKYLGQMVYAGYQLISDQPDRDGHPRNVIQFHLLELSALQDSDIGRPVGHTIQEPSARYSDSDLFDTRDDRETPSDLARQRAIARAEATRAAVLQRANGYCEGCGRIAPFRAADGTSYLETHHVRRKTDGGADDPRWVIALCPNCHRRAHKAVDSASFNDELKAKLAAMRQEKKGKSRS